MDTEKEETVREKTESSAEKPDTLGESSPVLCELDASDIHLPTFEETSRGKSSSISIPSGGRGRGSSLSFPNGVAETSVYSDESVQSRVTNGSYKGNVSNWQTKIWRRK